MWQRASAASRLPFSAEPPAGAGPSGAGPSSSMMAGAGLSEPARPPVAEHFQAARPPGARFNAQPSDAQPLVASHAAAGPSGIRPAGDMTQCASGGGAMATGRTLARVEAEHAPELVQPPPNQAARPAPAPAAWPRSDWPSSTPKVAQQPVLALSSNPPLGSGDELPLIPVQSHDHAPPARIDSPGSGVPLDHGERRVLPSAGVLASTAGPHGADPGGRSPAREAKLVSRAGDVEQQQAAPAADGAVSSKPVPKPGAQLAAVQLSPPQPVGTAAAEASNTKQSDVPEALHVGSVAGWEPAAEQSTSVAGPAAALDGHEAVPAAEQPASVAEPAAKQVIKQRDVQPPGEQQGTVRLEQRMAGIAQQASGILRGVPQTDVQHNSKAPVPAASAPSEPGQAASQAGKPSAAPAAPAQRPPVSSAGPDEERLLLDIEAEERMASEAANAAAAELEAEAAAALDGGSMGVWAQGLDVDAELASLDADTRVRCFCGTRTDGTALPSSA